MWCLSETCFQKRENVKPEKHTQVKQWPDAQYSPDPEFPDINLLVHSFFFNQQEGDQKSAEYEEKVYAKVSVAEEILFDEMIESGILD